MTMATLQVRDLPDEVLVELKERAEKDGVSLSFYVRELLTDAVSYPPMDEVMARIASREPVRISTQDVLDAIREGRR